MMIMSYETRYNNHELQTFIIVIPHTVQLALFIIFGLRQSVGTRYR